MKEFLIDEKIDDVSRIIKIPRKNKCYIVTNAELGTMYAPGSALSSYPRLSSPHKEEERRSKALADSFEKGIRKL